MGIPYFQKADAPIFRRLIQITRRRQGEITLLLASRVTWDLLCNGACIIRIHGGAWRIGGLGGRKPKWSLVRSLLSNWENVC